MPYLDQQPEDTWQKRLFDKLKNVEDKLDRLLVLREQEIDTTVHPPLKPEYCARFDRRDGAVKRPRSFRPELAPPPCKA